MLFSLFRPIWLILRKQYATKIMQSLFEKGQIWVDHFFILEWLNYKCDISKGSNLPVLYHPFLAKPEIDHREILRGSSKFQDS